MPISHCQLQKMPPVFNWSIHNSLLLDSFPKSQTLFSLFVFRNDIGLLTECTETAHCPTMAPPPPSSSVPLQQRLLQLVQTLQFGWFSGHVVLLICTLRYGISYLTFHYFSKWARFSYRTAFVAAAATYGIVVFKSFRARQRSGKSQGGALAIIGDENVQYLGMPDPNFLSSEPLTLS